MKGSEKIRIINVSEVPLTLNGQVKFMIANVLAATLASYLYGFTTNQIVQSLQSFIPSYEQTPGRMNMFECRSFNVMVDYAHNPHGYSAVEDYLKQVTAKRKVGIISGIGDRRDEDIKECALIAGRMFDHVIIRQEHDLRGRTEEQINSLLIDGLSCCEKQVTHEYVAEETEAIRHALEHAHEGDLIVALTDQITPVVNVIREYQAKEEREHASHYQSA
jgi:cyanophycin synthetase